MMDVAVETIVARRDFGIIFSATVLSEGHPDHGRRIRVRAGIAALGGVPGVGVSESSGMIGPPPRANHLALTETEVEAVRDFVDGRRLRARGLLRAEDGAIESMDGRRFSDPGFVEALQKIVQSYEG